MLAFHKLLTFVLLVGRAWAIPRGAAELHDFKEYKVKEALLRPPVGWTLVGEAPSDHIISLRVGLPQSNFEALEQHLFEVSDPDHSRYGQHLSKEEVEELVAPPPESLKKVNAWLKAHGFKEIELDRSPAKDWVSIKVPVKIAEQMLRTVSLFSHCASREFKILILIIALSQSLPLTEISRLETRRVWRQAGSNDEL
jgi:tripeptidyl-peptidase-1